MSSGERSIGAAKGTQSDAEALCQPPPPCGSAQPPQRVFEHEGTLMGGSGGRQEEDNLRLCT